ncbi:hypothetical protein N431DRAFT_457249 [Stipitochalara longipes BDJ]|nr:hypothetical protein N431DRAFT_457249 [Stipitochalara longipes BDJ]
MAYWQMGILAFGQPVASRDIRGRSCQRERVVRPILRCLDSCCSQKSEAMPHGPSKKADPGAQAGACRHAIACHRMPCMEHCWVLSCWARHGLGPAGPWSMPGLADCGNAGMWETGGLGEEKEKPEEERPGVAWQGMVWDGSDHDFGTFAVGSIIARPCCCLVLLGAARCCVVLLIDKGRRG